MRTLLIVEDTEPSASTLEIALSAVRDVSVVSVGRGEDAWSLLGRHPSEQVCALVTDLHMPGMDGFELIEKVRADRRYAKLPIIVISGSTDPCTPARVAELGASAFFEKPFSPAKVRAKVEQLLDGNYSQLHT